MATKKKAPEPDMLTSAAQTIGSTLGKLAAVVGIEHPAAAPVAKKSAAAVKKRAPAKKPAPKKAAAKKTARSAKKTLGRR
jgi:hypothetical protein